MTQDFSITQIDVLDRCLGGLCDRAEADLALLADITGQLVASQGDTQGMDVPSLAALAAANLAATAAIAAKVGEHASCESLLYESEHTRIYIVAAPFDLILLVVAGERIPIGAVRFFIGKTLQELDEILPSHLEQAGEREEPLLGQDFQTHLDDELRALFSTGPDIEEVPPDEDA